jgi:hypothetical protein
MVRIHRRGRKRLRWCTHPDGAIVKQDSGWTFTTVVLLRCKDCGAEVKADPRALVHDAADAYRHLRTKFDAIRRIAA